LKHGRNNFKKEILFEFKTSKKAYNKELEIVDENFVKRDDKNDPRWLSGELVASRKYKNV